MNVAPVIKFLGGEIDFLDCSLPLERQLKSYGIIENRVVFRWNLFHDEFVALMSENMKRKIGNDLMIFPRKGNTTQL